MEYTISFVNNQSRKVHLPAGTFRCTEGMSYNGPLSPDDFCELLVTIISHNISPPPSILRDFIKKYSPQRDDLVVSMLGGRTIQIPKEAVVDATINLPTFLEAIASGDAFDGDKSVYSHLFHAMVPEILARVTRPEFIQQVLTIITTSADDEAILSGYLRLIEGYLSNNGLEDLVEAIKDMCTDAIARRME